MVQKAEQLGASLLSRVGETRSAKNFTGADRATTFDNDFKIRTAQTLLRRGVAFTEKVIQNEIDSEIIRGSTLALAGQAEEEMETSLLTKNFTVAGHRSMTAKIRHQEWQATMLKELADGNHNDRSPQEYGKYLNESAKDIIGLVNGMSLESKQPMLETILTGNQSLIAKQAELRTSSIVSSKMQLYSVQANSLLTEAQENRGSAQEDSTIQQVQALVREIYADPNLPQEVKSKLINDLQTGSAKMGLVGVSRGVMSAPVSVNADGTYQTYGSTAGIDNYTKGIIEINKAIKADRWVNNTQGRLAFTELQAQINHNSFTGTDDDLVEGIIFARNNEIISEGEANALFKKHTDNKYLDRNATKASELYKANNIAGMQKLKVSYDEAKKAYIREGIDMGLDLTQQVSRISSTFKLSNGDTNAVDWISSDILKPILNEVINSDGDILTENGQLFNHIISEVNSVDETKQGLYIASLLQSLDPLQSDFVMKFIGDQKLHGADAQTALSNARVNYLRAVDAKEIDRSEAVRQSSKNIAKALDQFSDVGMFNNFFGNRTIGKLWKETDKAKTTIGSPTWFRTAHNTAVSQAYTSLSRGLEEDLKNYVRQTGRVMEESELQTFIAKGVLDRVKGENGNSVVFDSKDRVEQMFPNVLTQELKGQQDELISYVIGNLSDQDGYSDVVRSYTFSDGMLKVNIIGNDGQYIPKTYVVEDYIDLVEDYKADRLKRSETGSWDEMSSRMVEASKRTKTEYNGTDYNFHTSGYDAYGGKYSRNMISELYEEVIPLEGMELKRYSDGSGGRYSIAMGVNSINATDPKYKPYFDIEKRTGSLTKAQAESLTEIAVKDHLDKTSKFLAKKVGRDAMNSSEDLQKGIFKLMYSQGSISDNVADKIIDGVTQGNADMIIEGLNSSPFFKLSVGSNPNHPHYQYILTKLIGAMDDFSERGIE